MVVCFLNYSEDSKSIDVTLLSVVCGKLVLNITSHRAGHGGDMYTPNLLLALILAQSAVLSLASPAPTSPLTIRDQLCANLPNTVAGTVPHTRHPQPAPPPPPAPSPLHFPSTGVIWCLQDLPVYIILDSTPLPAHDPLIPVIQGALENATSVLLHNVEAGHDGPVTAWVFRWPPTENLATKGVMLVGQSVKEGTNMKWSSLNAAFMAFWDYMQRVGYGFGQFRIYYGAEGLLLGKGQLKQNLT